MSDLTNVSPMKVEDIIGEISKYKYNPSAMVNTSLDLLSSMLNGDIELVDPSNPFIYLLETSCLNTVFSIQEYSLLTRKLYPRLANNENDLYLHMSDYDYLGRFSEPSSGFCTFNIMYSSFKSHAKYDSTLDSYIFKIPRHYKISVGNYIFTTLYPILIRETSSGVMDIRFLNDDVSDLQSISTDYIEYFLINQFNNEKYIVFNIPVLEVDLEYNELPIEKSKLFTGDMQFNSNRKFYYLEAFYYDNNKWNKMLVTHTNEIYDINNPTIIIKVLQEENTINYYIPPVYINNNKVGSKVKFVIYTTSGYIDVNFNDYNLSDFTYEYNPVFKDKDLDIYTSPLELIYKLLYIKDKIIGGKDRMSFDALKDSVIENSIGDRKLPITDKQLEFLANQNVFKLIKSVDTVTRRIYRLQINLPKPNSIFNLSVIDLDIFEYANSLLNMLSTNSVQEIDDFTYIIPKDTIFTYDDENKLRLLSDIEKNNLENLSGVNLTSELNSKMYASTFFHYIISLKDNTTSIKAYNLDTPKMKNINFKNFNNSVGIGVNTKSFSIVKQDTGYLIEVLANIKPYNDTSSFMNISSCLVYELGSTRYYLEGSLITVIDGNPLYHFYLNSNFNIDDNDNISFSNFKDENGFITFTETNLLTNLQLLYLTDNPSPTYTPIYANSIISSSYLGNDYYLVTQEELNIEFGKELKYLMKDIHNSTSAYEYQTYNEDVQLKYKENVYDENDNLIHEINDFVFNETGDPVFEYRVGDVKLDIYGNPIPNNELDIIRYFNLLCVDYKVTRCTNINMKNYLNTLKEYLVEIVTYNAENLQEQLLENTEAYVTIPKTLDSVKVKLNNGIISTISSQQAFTVDIYIKKNVYENTETKNNINNIVTDTLDSYLRKNNIISRSEIITELHSSLKDFISNISFSKFTELNIDYIEILSDESYFSIHKNLTIESDGEYNIVPDVTINYIQID